VGQASRSSKRANLTPAEVFAPLPPGYKPREPEGTVLHGAFRDHLETYVSRAQTRFISSGALPHHVERELRAYPRCGVLAFGMARARCDDCGHTVFVGFSCKGRGFCPSCTSRRSHESAVFLTDHVFPEVPVRQWVLTFPRRIRYHLFRDPKLMDQVLRAFIRLLNRYYRQLAQEEEIKARRIGAVTFIQNFGSALNLNTHFHNMMPDGVFDHDGIFFKVRKPRQYEVEQLLYVMAEKTLKLLANKFAQIDEVEFDHEYDRLLASSVNIGRAPQDTEFPNLNGRLSASLEGFSLHAATRIHENDRAGRQRLLSYGARGPIAQSRLSKLPDGRFRYEMRRPMGTGQTELFFEGPELIGRLAALIPTPRKNMIRFFGVFAPASRLRSKVVPGHDTAHPKRHACSTDLEPDPNRPQDPKVQALMEHYQKANDARKEPSRIDWATLLKRTFGIDLSTCSKCGGKRRVIATIKDGPAIKKVLEHLGLPPEPFPMAPARAPPQPDFFEAA
jgi:hypothetical protein